MQRVRKSTERDPLPLPKEMASVHYDIGIDIDATESNDESKLTQAIDLAKRNIAAADHQGGVALSDLSKSEKSIRDVESSQSAIHLYREAFHACAEVLKLDKLAFQAEWFKDFYQRNYDALMVRSVYDNVFNDVDKVREWMDALRRGTLRFKANLSTSHDNGEEVIKTNSKVLSSAPSMATLSTEIRQTDSRPLSPVVGSSSQQCLRWKAEESFFANPEEHNEQDIVDAIIDSLFYYEKEKVKLKSDPLVRLLIPNQPGRYEFTIVTAMGVITEGKKGLELHSALKRLEEERGIKTIRADTGTARSFEYNAGKIEEAIQLATKLQKPFGLLGYSQGCANVLTAESLMLSGKEPPFFKFRLRSYFCLSC